MKGAFVARLSQPHFGSLDQSTGRANTVQRSQVWVHEVRNRSNSNMANTEDLTGHEMTFTTSSYSLSPYSGQIGR